MTINDQHGPYPAVKPIAETARDKANRARREAYANRSPEQIEKERQDNKARYRKRKRKAAAAEAAALWARRPGSAATAKPARGGSTTPSGWAEQERQRVRDRRAAVKAAKAAESGAKPKASKSLT